MARSKRHFRSLQVETDKPVINTHEYQLIKRNPNIKLNPMKKLLLICAFFLFGNHFLNAQALVAGDIAFIGFQQDTPDGFTFITLTDINAGEVIYFTDHSWSSTDNIWHTNTGDAHFAWTVPAGGVPIGTIVSVTESSTDTLTPSVGTMAIQGGGSFSLVQSGDVLIAYQSTNGAQSTVENMTFLAAIYTDDNFAHNTGCDGLQGWFNSTGSCESSPSYPPTGSNASGIPNGLTNGVNALHLYPSGVFEADSENDNGRYIGTLDGDAAIIRAAIHDRTNWELKDTLPFDITGTYFNSNTTVNVTSSTLGLVASDFSNELLIFPNPTSGNLSIDLGDVYPLTTITITNLQGKIIQSGSYKDKQLLPLQLEAATGVYLLKIEAGVKKAHIRIIKD